MNPLQTEFDFTLPKGYIDGDGNLHRDGIMRLATAGDEISPHRDPRVQKNPAFLVVILLSRVITRLGAVEQINTGVIEQLFAEDLAFLQDFYNQINGAGGEKKAVVCPECKYGFETEMIELGGS